MNRLVLFLALGLPVAVALAAFLDISEPADRGAISVFNPEHRAPVDSLEGGVLHLYNETPAEHLVLDSVYPEEPVTLLWFQGLGTSPIAGGGALTLDGGGGAVRFDEHLTPQRVPMRLEGREPTSIAAGTDGDHWVVDTDGIVHRVDASGKITGSTSSGFAHASAVTDPAGGVWISRSSRMFAFRLATAQDPLLVHIDSQGVIQENLGSIVLPSHVLLAEIANGGHVAVHDDVIYYAPFIRDEVVAFSRTGDTLWVAHRGFPQTTADPRIELAEDGPTLDYAPVNLGIAVGPDGLLYVLSVPGFTTSESRVDVLDPASGALVRSAMVAEPLPTLAASADGRVYAIDPFRLLTGVAPRDREPFAPFDLERLGGGRMALSDLVGKVVLVNFWASWCAPCRTEMPALDSLRHGIDDPDFLFITMNEDIDVADAEEFIDEFGFEFPVLLGRGKLERTYHYYGLPLTVAIDREGRVLQRWIGYAGEAQLQGIKAVIEAELMRGDDGPEVSGSGTMQHAGH